MSFISNSPARPSLQTFAHCRPCRPRYSAGSAAVVAVAWNKPRRLRFQTFPCGGWFSCLWILFSRVYRWHRSLGRFCAKAGQKHAQQEHIASQCAYPHHRRSVDVVQDHDLRSQPEGLLWIHVQQAHGQGNPDLVMWLKGHGFMWTAAQGAWYFPS